MEKTSIGGKWDPLESIDANADLITIAKKKEIYNILKSYVGFYDPFCELLQNAMDAVDTRKRELKEPDYIKKIWIRVDLKKNLFSVSDNGIGFKETEFRTFLCPSVSFKDSSLNRGNKGVGATYLAYGFNHLQLGTKSPDFAFVAEIKDGRKWVDDNKGIVTRPYVIKAKLIHDVFNGIDRGSTFTIRFGGENTRPKDMNWIGAEDARQWETIFLIKTPLGHISLEEGADDPIHYVIEVIDKAGKVTSANSDKASYIFPHTVVPSSANLKEILDHEKAAVAKAVPVRLPGQFKKLNGLYSYWQTSDLLSLMNIKDGSQKDLMDVYSISAYGFFCYSTKVWDAYSDDIAKLRKGTRILRGGLQLACNKMPQGDLITIPLTSNIGYQNQAHIVVHFTNADPDLGRKGFQPELRELGEEIAVSIVNILKKRRDLLKKDTGVSPFKEDQALYDWVRNQEDYEKVHPLRIRNSNFFIPMNEISITGEPQQEQDVVVLFNQLIAGGVIRGIKIMASSTHKQYDGVIRYFVNKPLAHHIFDKANNPLGVMELQHTEGFISKPYVLEYKYNVDALIQEFESGEKIESNVNLVVAWDVGSEWKKKYEVTSLLNLDNLHHRVFHGLTHVFHDDVSGIKRFDAIILKELMAYLDNVDAAQPVQKAVYGDIL